MVGKAQIRIKKRHTQALKMNISTDNLALSVAERNHLFFFFLKDMGAENLSNQTFSKMDHINIIIRTAKD